MTPEDQGKFPPIQATLKNSISVTLRPLLPQDGEAMAEFYAAIPLHNIRFYGPYPLDRENALANAEKATSPDEVVLVMESPDSRIAGYAWYRWEGEEAADSVFGICIRPEFQECGAGGLLMTRLLEIAKSIGPPVMTLTVQLANVRALALYTRMGFIKVREQMCHRERPLGFEDEAEYYMEQRMR